MKKIITTLSKIVLGIVVLAAILLITAAILLNTQKVQDELAAYATEQLELELGTRVKIKHASVNVFTQKVNLEGLEVEDLEHRKMFEMGRLLVDVNLMNLIANNLVVEEVLLDDVKAKLYKPLDGPANYQFLIDAFKKDPKQKKEKKEQKDSTQKSAMTLDVNKVELKNIALTFNDTNQVSLESVTYENGWFGKHSGALKNLKGQWGFKKKKGPVTAKFAIGSIKYKGQNTVHHLNLGQVHFATDNHKPRKNHDRPKRGFFDVDHLDVDAQMDLTLDYISEDSLHAVMNHMEAKDSVTGFNLKKMHFDAGIMKERVHLQHIMIQQETTVLKFDSANVVLPSKKLGRKFSFETSRIKGQAQLRDISRPFAPVLKNFTMPLELDVLFSGTDTTLFFRDVHVYTPDKKLQIAAEGRILNLKEKEKLDVGFHIKEMKAQRGVPIQVINQFAVKKLMLNQLDALGTIYFTGDFAVLWKKEVFDGQLRTDVGALAFNFALDEKTKYVTGSVHSRKIKLGKVLNMDKLDDVGAQATFIVDIHKARTAMIRKKYGGGKLPIGEVKATVFEAGYGGFRLKNMQVEFASNGSQAEGFVSHSKSMMDWDCTFIVNDVDKKNNVKVKPKVKLKLGNLFKTKQQKEEDKKKAEAEKPKKDNLFRSIFKKKDKDTSKK
jgi:hypothetical protein